MMFMVVGLGFGDEGKGSITDYLVQSEGAGLVVRFNGGPQAAHHVVSPKGVRHCFAQFGSGTLVPGVRTLLAKDMLVEPLALLHEAEVLAEKGVSDALGRLTIDERAVVVTPFHRTLNRMREIARGAGRHGTCGLGVGEARLDAESGVLPTLRIGDLRAGQHPRRILRQIQQVKIDHGEQLLDTYPETAEQLRELLASLSDPRLVDDLLAAYTMFRNSGLCIVDGEGIRRLLRAEPRPVFEGAQGVLLDRDRGFWPHVTPSCTGFGHALELLSEAEISEPLRRIGVIRAYATRHGEGPFVSEDLSLAPRLAEADNRGDGWQGTFRLGSLDMVMLRYALRSVGGVDGLALTNLDRLVGWQRVPLCVAYTAPERSAEYLEELFQVAADGLIHDLEFPCEVERERQGRLTKSLEGCRPVVEEMPGWLTPDPKAAKAFVRRLEEECGVQVVVESWGPSSMEKRRSF